MADALEPCPDCGSTKHKSCPSLTIRRRSGYEQAVEWSTKHQSTVFSIFEALAAYRAEGEREMLERCMDIVRQHCGFGPAAMEAVRVMGELLQKEEQTT